MVSIALLVIEMLQVEILAGGAGCELSAALAHQFRQAPALTRVTVFPRSVHKGRRVL